MTLFGILPAIIAIKRAAGRWKKGLAYFMLVLFSLFFILEFLQETGLIDMEPHAEYWFHNMQKHVDEISQLK